MKAPLVIVLFLMILGSCTETIIVPEYIIKDSLIYVPGKDSIVYQDRVLLRVDTVKVTTTIIDKDTVYIVDYDSIFVTIKEYVYITKTDTVYQTVYDTVTYHHYNAVEYIFPGQTVYYVPQRYKKIVDQFPKDAARFGRQNDLIGGDLLIEPWTDDEAPPDNRSSFSYMVWSQFILKLKESLQPDSCYTPIYRELARWQLNKPYTKDTTIMNPAFSPLKLKMSDSQVKKDKYLKILFAR